MYECLIGWRYFIGPKIHFNHFLVAVRSKEVRINSPCLREEHAAHDAIRKKKKKKKFGFFKKEPTLG